MEGLKSASSGVENSSSSADSGKKLSQEEIDAIVAEYRKNRS